MSQAISQHKLMAMGKVVPRGEGGRFAKGGSVPRLKTGIPTSPITDAKRANDIPGYCDGGKMKK